MNAVDLIKGRRSVRKYKAESVDRGLMKEVVDLSRWAPSWANFQVARYTLVDDKALISKIASNCVKGFDYNIKTLETAPGVAVLSFVKGKSGKLDPDKATEDANASVWETFDAGIACQTFCLSAHAKGIGTCIFGVIDKDSIAAIIDLPGNETVAALVVYGYEEEGPTKATPRKEVSDILRFL